MNLKRIEEAFACHNQLFGLFFNRQRSDQCSDFFGSLPCGQLAKTLLTSPDTRVNDLQEQLPGLRIEDKNCPVDRLGRQIPLKRFVNSYPVNVGVVNEQLSLVAE